MTEAANPFAQLDRVDLPAPGRKSPVTDAPSIETIAASASNLVPMLRERAQQTEQDRRVSEATTQAFHDAGFFRLMQPARYGGYEYGFTAFIDVVSELARGCTSSSWGCSLGAIHQWLVAIFPEEAQDDVWRKDPRAIVCGSYAPATMAEKVDGGYRVQGKWLFASNVDNSQWALLGVQFPPEEKGAPPTAGFCSRRARTGPSRTTGTWPARQAPGPRRSSSTSRCSFRGTAS